MVGSCSAWSGLLSACARPPEPARVAINDWLGYQTLTLAQELGYFQQTAIRIIESPSNTASMIALANKEIPMAALTLDEFLLARENGVDLRVVLVFDESRGADVVLGRPGLRTLTDLKGQRIGVESTAVGALMLTKVLEMARLQPAEVQKVELTLDRHEAAFAEGEVDALVTFEPVATQLRAQGAQVLMDSRQVPGMIVDVLVGQADFLNEHGEAVRQLLRAHFQAQQAWQRRPDEAARLLAPRLKLQGLQMQRALAGLHMLNVAENQAWLAGVQPQLLTSVQVVGDLALRASLLKQPPSLTALCDDRFLPEEAA